MDVFLNRIDIDNSFFDYEKINTLYDFFLIENKGNSFKPDSDILYEPLIKKNVLAIQYTAGSSFIMLLKKDRLNKSIILEVIEKFNKDNDNNLSQRQLFAPFEKFPHSMIQLFFNSLAKSSSNNNCSNIAGKLYYFSEMRSKQIYCVELKINSDYSYELKSKTFTEALEKSKQKRYILQANNTFSPAAENENARFGDDSTVITHRIGMRIAEQVKLSKRDTMETVGAILSVFRRCQKEHPEVQDCWVRVDDTGVGGGVTDRLREVAQESDLPIRVIPVNNGAAAEDEFYHNLGAQLWGQLRDLLEENMSASLQGQAPILQLPRSDELAKQLIGRKYKMSSRGKIQLERKEDMKKRGLESPDCADSLALCLYEPRVARIKFFKDGI